MITVKEESIKNIKTIKNQINLQTELILRQKKLNKVKRDRLVCNKENFLQKINEIENLVLKNDMAKKFFVLIPNEMGKNGLVKFSGLNYLISKTKFNSLLGKLVIFDHLPDEELIKKLM